VISSATVVASGLGFPEGPLPTERGLLFVEQYRSRVSRLEHGVEAVASVGGNPNGLAAAADGRVWVARGPGAVGAWRSEPQVTGALLLLDPETGRHEVVATSAGGRALRAPNDVVVGPDGAVYFTDPGPFAPEADHCGWICRYDGEATTIYVELSNVFPNGLAFDARGRLTWVESHTRRVARLEDGEITEIAVLDPPAIPDGMCFLADGRLVVAQLDAGGLDVVDVDGRRVLDRIVWSDGVALTNVARDGSVLWATDVTPNWSEVEQPTGRIWRLELSG
jgi:gluconolactonase